MASPRPVPPYGGRSTSRPARRAGRSSRACRGRCRRRCRTPRSGRRSSSPAARSASRDPDDDLACLGELDRIADEVGQHLPHAARGRRVTTGGTECSMTAISSRSLACAGPASRSVTSVDDRRAGRTRCRSTSSLPASIFEKSRMSLMIASKRLARVAHGLRVVPLSGVEVGVEQEVGHADDAVHGGADLVAHVGEEVGLEPRRLGRLVAGLGHRRLRPRLGGHVGERPDPARVAAVHVGNRTSR